MLTPAPKDPDETEPYESRIKKPNVTLPSVVELRINTHMQFYNEWPRAVDLIDCCPNLKKVNLTGDQYLMDDLLNLPTTIEEIEYGFLTTDEEVGKLKRAFPMANIEKKLRGGYMNYYKRHARESITRRRAFRSGMIGSQSLDVEGLN